MRLLSPNVNKVIWLLVLSDLFMLFAIGLLSPFLAIFITQRISGGSLFAAGVAIACYYVVRTVSVLPLARFMDKTDGERDEFVFLFSGLLLYALSAFLYMFATRTWHVYALQGMAGFAYSMATPGWRIIFTNHLDRGKMAFEWSLDDVALGLSTAASACVGAWVAGVYGFTVLFAVIGNISVFGALVLLPIRNQLRSRKELLKFKVEVGEGVTTSVM